jgi:hypothetical protein
VGERGPGAAGNDGVDEARHAGALDEVRAALDGIVERLDELAFDVLREASAAGRSTRPALERRLVRARNAVERARRLLEPGGSVEDG